MLRFWNNEVIKNRDGVLQVIAEAIKELRMPIENLLRKLASPAQRAIQSTGVTTIEELAEMSETEIMGLHGIGKNAMKTIKAFMAENGLSFKKS